MDLGDGETDPRPVSEADGLPILTSPTRHHLGGALRAIYEDTFDTQPIPDGQIDLLLRLRHKERDRRRVG
ncbi:hypothetical protein [Methylobacterium sp. E-045]|uniref:hypothetical protein n=1 Tax=Methylobacterium sp. E-045 TaxID=2836575 RepID=UPI001FBB47F3|nr:hypothetical protein [Methylobacterium sp. E-045]MCJ2128294.1 hypothetical protein [Methylobacterium sp. E-045]